MEEEFFGNLELKTIKNEQNFRDEFVDWVIVDSTLTNNKYREIEDGDWLEVYNTNGQLMLSKNITRDYDTYYNPTYKKQMYGGMAVKWLPKGIDVGYWTRLFSNNCRARIVKNIEV